MGQYYKIVNPAKQQYLHPHCFGDGLKLLEFGSSSMGTLLGLTILLADGNGRGGGDIRSSSAVVGSWAGDPVVITGDYAENGRFLSAADLLDYKEQGNEGVPTLYSAAHEMYENISFKVIRALCEDPFFREKFKQRLSDGCSFGMQENMKKMDPALFAELIG